MVLGNILAVQTNSGANLEDHGYNAFLGKRKPSMNSREATAKINAAFALKFVSIFKSTLISSSRESFSYIPYRL